MTLHIILGALIGFGLFILFSKRNQKENLQVVSNQHNSDHQSHKDSINKQHSNHNHKKGHGCC